jgi:hypothetical protein
MRDKLHDDAMAELYKADLNLAAQASKHSLDETKWNRGVMS